MDPEKAKPEVGLESGESSPETAPAPSPTSADAAALGEQLTKVQAEREDLRQTLVRLQADFENYRKRIERERHEGGQRAVVRVIESLLPVLDGFERALAAHDDPSYEEYRKGFQLIYRQLWEALSREGLGRIEAEGKRFDPHVHHAIERVESEAEEDGAVVEVLQPGYTFRGRVLRPATVRVAVHSDAKTPGTAEPVN